MYVTSYVYIADEEDGMKSILKYDKDGKYMTQWGSFGTGVGEFSMPTGALLT